MALKSDVFIIFKEDDLTYRYFTMQMGSAGPCWTRNPARCQTFNSYEGAKAVKEEWNLNYSKITPIRIYKDKDDKISC